MEGDGYPVTVRKVWDFVRLFNVFCYDNPPLPVRRARLGTEWGTVVCGYFILGM